MGIYVQDREELTLAIDTDSYSGNFERQMFAFITGRGDTPEGATNSNHEHYTKLAEAGWFDEVLDDLLDVRLNDPGDDGYHRAYVTIAPTPGFFNDGHGEHLEDNEKNRRKVAEKKRHPAFQSVAIFLQRMPTPEELAHIKKRAHLFSDLPKKNPWDARPKILGFRLLRARTTWSSEKV